MKTGKQIITEYNNQSSHLETFKTLEEMIDENSRTIMEDAAKIADSFVAPGAPYKNLDPIAFWNAAKGWGMAQEIARTIRAAAITNRSAPANSAPLAGHRPSP